MPALADVEQLSEPGEPGSYNQPVLILYVRVNVCVCVPCLLASSKTRPCEADPWQPWTLAFSDETCIYQKI